MYFILNYAFSVSLLIFFHLSGKNFFRLFLSKKNFKKEELIVDITPLYVILGLFWFGNILIVLNFLIPIKNIIYVFLIIFIIIEKSEIINSIRANKFSIFSLFFLVHSVLNNNPSQDSKMYHFYVQNLMLNEKLIIGISNFDPLYGLTSIFDYLSSSVWIGNNYGYSQLLNLIVISTFYNFLFIQIKDKILKLSPIAISIILIGFLDNFGLGGGRNGFIFIQEIGKFDNVYAVLFLLTSIFFYFVSKNYEIDSINFSIFFLMATFLAQLRSMGYLMLFFVFILLIFMKRLTQLRNNKILIFFNLIWILKNFLTSSCLIYPVQLTCISYVKWHWPLQSINLSLRATSNNRNPNYEISEFFSLSWFREYWIYENLDYILNFIISFVLLFIFLRLTSSNIYINKSHSLKLIKVCLLSYLISWFFIYPNYRFISGILLSIYVIFNINLITNMKKKLIVSKLFTNTSLFFLVITMIFTVRLDSYLAFYKYPNISYETRHQIPSPNLTKRVVGYGFTTIDFYCYSSLECSKSNQLTRLDKKLGYKIFIPLNMELYD